MVDIKNIFDSIKESFPILKQLQDEQVFSLDLTEDCLLQIMEMCDGYFDFKLSANDCYELGNAFFELGKFLKTLKILGLVD